MSALPYPALMLGNLQLKSSPKSTLLGVLVPLSDLHTFQDTVDTQMSAEETIASFGVPRRYNVDFRR